MITFPHQAITIIFLNSIVLLFHRLLPFSSSSTPFWIRLALILDTAIEFPLVFAFHPFSPSYNFNESPRLPTSLQLMLQVAVFFAVEVALQNYVLRFIKVQPETPYSKCEIQRLAEYPAEELEENGDAEGPMMDFARPRATLLLVIALLGVPTTLNQYTGELHPVAMVLWVVLQQQVKFGNKEVS